jgi:hypothetical protein
MRGPRRRSAWSWPTLVSAAVLACAGVGVDWAHAAPRSTARTVDRTVSCSVPVWGGVNLLRLAVAPRRKPIIVDGKPEVLPAGLGANVGTSANAVQLVALSSAKPSYLLDDTLCAPAARIPLARAGLPLAVTARLNGESVSRDCWVASRVTLRIHATLNRSGAPLAGELAIRSGPKLRPVAFIDWTPSQARVFVSSGFCHEG